MPPCLRGGSRSCLAIALTAVGLAAGCGDAIEAGSFRFEEVPETSGFDFRHELPGGVLDNLVKASMGGLAAIDYDGDGRMDLFCSNGGWEERVAAGAPRPAKPARCRLYRNLGGMRFEDVTDRAGVGFEGAALGACAGDFDGDGRTDLFVPAYGMPALYRNRGDGTFEDVAARAGLTPGLYAGATFLDYDRDGWIDLFASQYVDPLDVADDPREQRPGDFAPPAAYRAQPAHLWRGRGDGTFEDVTHRARVGTPGKGMGVLATDADGDGWIDVLVANDGMPNFLWRNQGDGTFADAAGRMHLAYGIEGDARASMGVSAADLDGDGRLDYLLPDTAGGAVYSGRADRTFTCRANDWGLAAASFRMIGWSDVAFDAENDGRLDVWKVHGDLRTLDPQWPKLASNRGPGPKGGVAFVYEPPLGELADAAEARVTGRGAVACDLDDDGLEDLVVLNLNGRARIFRNATERRGNWVRLRLVGKPGNTMALGALVTARRGGQPVVREVASSTTYICAPDPRIHVGLGSEDSLDDVVVRWPSGEEQRVGSLDAGREHVIRQP